MISLPQAGGMRKEIPGLPVYLEVKTEGDKADWASGAYSKALESRACVGPASSGES